MNKIRKNDHVIIRSGNHKGKRGKVSEVRGDKVIVEGLNVARKTKRPNPQANEEGGFVDLEMPIHVSNVALTMEDEGKAMRIGFKKLKDESKSNSERTVRYYKDSGEVVSGD